MPIAAKSLLILLITKTLLFIGLATQFDPMEEPIPYIIVVALTLSVLSLKTRRGWWFPLVVEVLMLVGAALTVVDSWSHGTSRNGRKIGGGVLVIVALTAIVLLLRRSVRDWYRSRRSHNAS